MGTGKGVISHDFAQPWPKEDAQKRIRHIVSTEFDYFWTDAVKAQMAESGLLTGDILHVCKHGVINDEGELSTQPGVFKYTLVSPTPPTQTASRYR